MYIQPKLKKRVEAFFDTIQQNMSDALGIAFTSLKLEEVKATMPVDENTVQPFGFLHGGASVALAETMASVGAWLNIHEKGKTAVGMEINANHIRAVKKGNKVHAISTPVHKGRQIQVWQTNIFNEDEKLVCTSRCTLTIVDQLQDKG